MRIGRGHVVDREHPPGPLFDRAQTDVGSDAIQPGAKRASLFVARESAPGTKQRVLERIFGVDRGRAVSTVPIAVRLPARQDGTAVGPVAVEQRTAGCIEFGPG